ncbi:MAG: hypothetical protein E7458_09965 [Ruminococcaceae bacterium]|nr:hypothetical protein [Oscillospiraceae bacterium]
MDHDKLYEIELEDCPLCRDGVGLLEDEQGWCIYVACMNCGSRTAEIPYKNEEERLEAARKAALSWNTGKVIFTGAGD